MRTGELEKLFGVSGTTVRNWVTEFAEFLTPSDTRFRQYTEADILVLATIAKLSQAGHPYPHIRERLKAGERVEHPGIANFGVDTRMVPAAAMEQIIDATELRVELEKVKSERDTLLDMHSKDQQVIQELNDEIKKLQRELGRAEGELEYRRSLDKRERE